ncbi:hypothetical protein SZN_19722 [Streptomyces zinciresistens K42]|uniref:Uncharacterized protein n=1 Tax=Streptomyces zinciresistens K42 TaxID=700597 RepID=G2GEL1_9ACTN|nr:hypothetical protein SZN_19722 [Streptomyces zinciresistens K42]
MPVRAPGRTMAEAERGRPQPAAESARPDADGPARDAGSRFGAFHRGRRTAGGPDAAADDSGAWPLPETDA